MSRLPLGAEALHRRRVRLRDSLLERASLFPLFDGLGHTHALMLVWPPLSNIVILKLEPDLVRVPLWGPIVVRKDLAQLEEIDADGAAALRHLWHYDPWWVLRDPRFTGHPGVPALKTTNCASRFLRRIHGCTFTRDLSSLEKVSITSDKPSGWAALDRTRFPFTPALLPERVAPAQPAPARPSWELNPFWLRGHWRLRA